MSFIENSENRNKALKEMLENKDNLSYIHEKLAARPVLPDLGNIHAPTPGRIIHYVPVLPEILRA